MNFFKTVAQSKLAGPFTFLMVFVPVLISYGQKKILVQNKDIPSMRTTNSYTVANEDGSYTNTNHSHPIHFKEEQALKPIDLNIIANPGLKNLEFPFVNPSNTLKSYIPSEISQGLLTETEDGFVIKDFKNPTVYAEMQGAIINPQFINESEVQVFGDKAVFPNIYSDIDLSVQMDFGRRKADYIIKSAEVLSDFPENADYLVFQEEVVLPDNWYAEIKDEVIVILNEQHKQMASFDKPLVIEPSKSSLPVEYEGNALNQEGSSAKLISFEIEALPNGFKLKTKVDLAWMRSTEREFPLIIDPDLISFQPTKVIFDEAWPNSNPVLNTYQIAPTGSLINGISLDFSAITYVATDVTYGIQMFDSAGDGWSGNSIQIQANGTQVLSTQQPPGASITRFFTVGHGDDLTATWTTGTNTGDISFNILNELGEIVYSGVFGSTIDYTVPMNPDYFLGSRNLTTFQYLWFDYSQVSIVDQTTIPILYASGGTTFISPGTGSSGDYGYSTDAFDGQDANQIFTFGLTTPNPDPNINWRTLPLDITFSITFIPPDCSALSTPTVTNADLTGITNVTFSNINNSSSATSGLVTTGVSTEVCRGGTYDLSARVNTGGNFTTLTKAWVDWNANDIFEEASEAYVLGYATNVTDGATDAPKSVDVPMTASISTVKMRVAVAYFGTNGNYPSACSDVAWGEFEDYLITVIKNPEITMASPVVDSSTCGIKTYPVSVDASDGNGSWDSNALGLFQGLPNEANNIYQTGVFGDSINVFWTSNVNEGICEGAVATAVILFNQPNTESITSSLVTNQSWLWGGLTNDDYTNPVNWYQWNGTNWDKSASELPTASSDVFVLDFDESGICVSDYNEVELISNVASLTIGNEASASLDGIIEVPGNIINLGSLTGASNSELRLSGTSNQTVGGGGVFNLYDFTITNGSNTVTLNNNLSVANRLNLEGGPLDNVNHLLTVGSSDDVPGVIDYTTGAGVVTGKLKSYFPNTTGSKRFPIGTVSKARDVFINFNISPPGVDQSLTMQFKSGTPLNPGGSPIIGLPITLSGIDISDFSTAGYWEIIPTDNDYTSTICTKPYSMTMHMQGLSDITNVSTTRILKSAGSNTSSSNHTEWTGLNAIASSGSISDFEITSITTGFSYFAAGKGNTPLPVELISFSGSCEGNEVFINWQTASEFNSDYFILSRSNDGIQWFDITQIEAAGFSNEISNYQFIDFSHNANSYYRLTQVDIDGQTEVFEDKIIQTSCDVFTEELLYTYPNPSFDGVFNLVYFTEREENIGIQIMNTQGKQIVKASVTSVQGMNTWYLKEELANGVYYIVLSGEGGTNIMVKHVVR
jgi:hypothetical protein